MNLGLGDAIAVSPIIAKLAQENGIVEIPCWERNLVSVESFFIDYPNIKVCPFKSESDMFVWAKNAELQLGHYATFGECKHRSGEDFVQWFYRQANFDISEKEKYCPILKASKNFETFIPEEDYNFIHDDYSRGFIIKDVRGFRAYHDPSEYDGSILETCGMLINAKEIHCIDSSFLHLVEALPVTGKLLYHKYARPNSTDYKYLKKEWKIIE